MPVGVVEMSNQKTSGKRPWPLYTGPWTFPALALEGWGQSLHEWRKANGCTREALAAHIGVSLLTVREWEKGRTLPAPAARKKIEEARKNS